MPMGFVLLVWLLPLTWSRQRRDDTLRTQALNVAAGPGGRVAAALKALPVSEAMGAEAATAALQSPHLRSCEATDASADTFTNTDTWQHCYSGSRCVVGGASSGHSNTGRTPASTCVGAVSCNHSLCRGPFNMAPTAPETPATSRWVLAPEASTPSLMSCLSPSLSAAAASSDVQGGQVEATRLIHAEKHAVHRASGWRGACDILTPLPMPRPSQSSVSPSTHQPVVMAPGSSKLLQSSGLVAFLSAPASLVRPLPSPSAASHCSRQAVRPLELNLRPSLTKPPLSTLLSTLPGADGDEGMLAATEVDHIKPLPRQHHSPLLYTPHRRSYFLHFQVDLTAAGDGEARGEAPRSSG
ncbi:hypothetical protein Vretifemale_6760 [Volvox reticuliferus]|uniref:Uncharacterized protein n=1 Tax=Volvox reticuliferus TaxID=1737510 RepID=A0A8J4C817_9CHLO|nr:hypothetical protein Vretifemale_6760 [Volvox reticuliferus]